MEAVIIDESRRNEWERYLLDSPHTIAWQSYEWSAVLRKHYRFDFHPIAVVDGSEIRGILPLYHIKDMFGRDMLLSVPYAVAGGISADCDEAVGLLLEKAVEISGRYDFCPITFKQYKERINRPLRTDENYYNRELDLTVGENALWNGLQERNGESIEASRSTGFRLEYPSDDLELFYRVLLKHQHSKGIPCVAKKWIKGLIECGMYSMALLKTSHGAVAATMIKEFKDTVSFPFTCMPTGNDKADTAVYRLYWELILWFASDGKRIFHSGRMPKNDRTDPYRLGWGGVAYDYYYQYYTDDPYIRTEFSTRKGKKRDLFEKCWKMMPTMIAGRIGPAIVKHFP